MRAEQQERREPARRLGPSIICTLSLYSKVYRIRMSLQHDRPEYTACTSSTMPIVPAHEESHTMPPRLTDWSLALAGALAFVSGIVSLDSGAPGQWTIFALHGAAGL